MGEYDEKTSIIMDDRCLFKIIFRGFKRDVVVKCEVLRTVGRKDSSGIQGFVSNIEKILITVVNSYV